MLAITIQPLNICAANRDAEERRQFVRRSRSRGSKIFTVRKYPSISVWSTAREVRNKVASRSASRNTLVVSVAGDHLRLHLLRTEFLGLQSQEEQLEIRSSVEICRCELREQLQRRAASNNSLSFLIPLVPFAASGFLD